MPHLSPLNWFLSLGLIWSLLLTLMSSIWWLMKPLFSTNSPSIPHTSSQWFW